ncbi:MAG: phage major capsid protein [Acidobacteriota bacterium]
MHMMREIAVRNAREHAGKLVATLTALDEASQPPKEAIGLSRTEIASYSVLRAIREIHDMVRARRAWKLDGVEGAAHSACVARYGEPQSAASFFVPPEVLRRDLTAASESGGGYLVGATTGGSYIEVLRNRSVIFRLGAQHLPGQKAQLKIPRQSAAGSASWLSDEGAAATESQQTLQQVTSDGRHIAAYTEISRQLLLQSSPSAEQLVMTDLAAVSAVAIDAAAIAGSGTAGQPTGIASTVGIGSFSGTSLGLDALAEAQADVLGANALIDPDTLGHATTPAVAKLLKTRSRFTGTDSPLWGGALHDGQIEGVRAISSLQVPSACMIYGDWSQLLIPEWGSLLVELNPYANFPAGIVGVRAMHCIDVIVRHAASFTVASSIT